jgi:hypothetical protein
MRQYALHVVAPRLYHSFQEKIVPSIAAIASRPRKPPARLAMIHAATATAAAMVAAAAEVEIVEEEETAERVAGNLFSPRFRGGAIGLASTILGPHNWASQLSLAAKIYAAPFLNHLF